MKDWGSVLESAVTDFGILLENWFGGLGGNSRQALVRVSVLAEDRTPHLLGTKPHIAPQTQHTYDTMFV